MSEYNLTNNSGNVGIGTTSSQNTLNVIGDINATGTIWLHTSRVPRNIFFKNVY